jgi:hypothetical protein
VIIRFSLIAAVVTTCVALRADENDAPSAGDEKVPQGHFCFALAGDNSDIRHSDATVVRDARGIENETAIVIADLSYSIRSLRWKGDTLEVLACWEWLEPSPTGKALPEFDRPAAYLVPHFWDAAMTPFPTDGFIEVILHPAFTCKGGMKRESRTLTIRPPETAAYIALYHGAWPTTQVAIPPRDR